ncbi:DUF192 domain-containing protein [Kiloniella sp. b19]|uniref:DUF192 domain-containing protein n=1 Tax=Kiloniella sp. GXU_MW_B19 TaxID=3141326 RepID=UPI0031D080DE
MIFFVVSFFLACLVLGRAESQEIGFGTGQVRIFDEKGLQRAEFSVEVARSQIQKSRGLMFREELPDSAGMIFLYQRPQILSMWMANTLIPLDMLFVAGDGTIVHIHENAVPLSKDIISSGADVTTVLEIAGGLAERLGIQQGDVLYFEESR